MKQKQLIRYGKFALFIIAMAIVGALSQQFLSHYDNQLMDFGAAILLQCRQNALVIAAIIFVIAFGGAVLYFRQAKRLMDIPDDSSEHQDALDNAAAISLIFSTTGEIVMLLLLGLFVSEDTAHLLATIALCVTGMFVLLAMEIRSVSLQKKISPEKRGDPLNFRFEKDWLNSCDEAEKFAVYRASYKSFILLKKLLPLFLVVTMIAHFTLNIGPLPFLITGVLWLIHTLSYFCYSLPFMGKRFPSELE